MERRLLGIAAAGAIAVAAAMVATATAAQQTSTVDRKVSCATSQAALQISASAKNPKTGAAAVAVSTSNANGLTVLVGVDTRYKHYKLGTSCRKVTTRIALTHRGLALAGVVRADQITSPLVTCSATRRVLIHFKLRFDSAGKPISATIAVRTKPKTGKSKALGYVVWTPQRAATYYSSRACTSK